MNYDQNRAAVAAELSRREFWKEVFLISFKQLASEDLASEDADNALARLDSKFGKGPALGNARDDN